VPEFLKTLGGTLQLKSNNLLSQKIFNLFCLEQADALPAFIRPENMGPSIANTLAAEYQRDQVVLLQVWLVSVAQW
jgi:hypothetical protein